MTISSPQIWKLGIIGAGGISEAHLEAVCDEPRAQVVAIADISLEMAKMRAEQNHIPHFFSDYQEMLKQVELDAVIICLPNFLHAQVGTEVLRMGKHVLCEKPLALNGAQAQDMQVASQAAGKVLMVGQNNRFRGDSLYLKQLVHAKHLGQIYHAKTGWVRRYGIPGWGSWFTQQGLAGGGPLIDIGVHMLDLTLWLLDYPAPLYVFGQTYAQFGPQRRGLSQWGQVNDKGRFDVEDMAVAMIKFENGMTLHLEASWAAHIEKEEAYVQLLGSEGGIYQDVLEENITLYHEIDQAPVTSTVSPPKQKERVLLLQNFIDAIEGKASPVCTPEQGVYVNRIIDAIYQSARTGEAVSWQKS